MVSDSALKMSCVFSSLHFQKEERHFPDTSHGVRPLMCSKLPLGGSATHAGPWGMKMASNLDRVKGAQRLQDEVLRAHCREGNWHHQWKRCAAHQHEFLERDNLFTFRPILPVFSSGHKA